MENVLESIGVTKNYAGKAAVDNVSLKLETGADRRAENQKTFHRYDGKVKDRSHNGKKCKTVSAG